MYNRPSRFRWVNLATQQIRLRNILRLSAHNINNLKSSTTKLHFTLHKLEDSQAVEAFYTSPSVDCRKHNKGTYDWPEINYETTDQGILKAICIKLWEDSCPELGEPSNSKKPLISWNVKLNDLVAYNPEQKDGSVDLSVPSEKFNENSLEFFTAGGSFVIPSSLCVETLREQIAAGYREEIKTGMIPIQKTPSTSRDDQEDGVSKSCDILYSCGRDEDLRTSKNTSYLSRSVAEPAFEINSPKTSRCNSETDDTISKNLVQMLRERSIQMAFNSHDVRRGCSLDKLLELQRLQRRIKSIDQESNSLIERISIRSADCFSYSSIPMDKKIFLRSSESQKATSMGRTLNRLLFEDKVIEPKEFLKSFELRKQLELFRIRKNILQTEFQKGLDKKKHLQDLLDKLKRWKIEQNNFVQIESEKLEESLDVIIEEKDKLKEREQVLAHVHRSLIQRQSQLCMELREIYPIVQRDPESDLYSINGIILPNADVLAKDNRQSQISPITLSVALGYVAHLIQITSIVLDIPLRNPVIHEGSRSKICDSGRSMSNCTKEFPLYSRTTIPSNPVLFAIFLLNQNIVQLFYQLTNSKLEIHKTLQNLHSLLSIAMDKYKYTRVKNDSTSSSHGEEQQLLNFHHQSNDSTLNMKVFNLSSDNGEYECLKKDSSMRISRSAGSYSDCDEPIIRDNVSSIYNSDSVLTSNSTSKTRNNTSKVKR